MKLCDPKGLECLQSFLTKPNLINPCHGVFADVTHVKKNETISFKQTKDGVMNEYLAHKGNPYIEVK